MRITSKITITITRRMSDRLLPSGNGRHDADFVVVFHRCGFLLEKADVFAVDEDVHKAADVAGFVADAVFEAGEGLVEIVEQFADGGAGGADFFEFVGELAERSGDEDGGHGWWMVIGES